MVQQYVSKCFYNCCHLSKTCSSRGNVRESMASLRGTAPSRPLLLCYNLDKTGKIIPGWNVRFASWSTTECANEITLTVTQHRLMSLLEDNRCSWRVNQTGRRVKKKKLRSCSDWMALLLSVKLLVWIRRNGPISSSRRMKRLQIPSFMISFFAYDIVLLKCHTF